MIWYKPDLFYIRKGCFSLTQLAKGLEWSLKSWGVRPWFPLSAKVELTRRCNSHCMMCARQTLSSCPDLESGDFNHIMDELKDIVVFSPHGFGEPLLHQDFLNFMVEVHRRKKQIQLVTNGSLLESYISLDFLRLCKPSKITFSVDAAEKGVYESIRRGLSYSRIVENIRGTVENRRRLKSKCLIEIYCTVGRYNMDQVYPVARLADELGVDILTFSDLTLHGAGWATSENAIRLTRNSIVSEIEGYKRSFPRLKIYSNLKRDDAVNANSCRWPFSAVFVAANGDIFPCSNTLRFKMGNIFESSFREIWRGENYMRFRQNFLFDPCVECKLCALY